MTRRLQEILDDLADERQAFKPAIAAIDADLAEERKRRIAVREGRIRDLVADAVVEGGSINKIMKAYGTKDFRTIKNLVASMENEIAMRIDARENPTSVQSDFFQLVPTDDGLHVNIMVDDDYEGFEIIGLDAGEYMLVSLGEEMDDSIARIDGVVLDSSSVGEWGNVWLAIHERLASE